MALTDPASSVSPASGALHPDAIKSAQFGTGFRGYDQDEVRVFLLQVADEVRRLLTVQRDLERRLDSAEAAARKAEPHDLDLHEVSTLLGEEAARVLETARAGAAEIQSRADEYAARTRRDADEHAQATRSEAERYVVDLRRTADSEADELRAQADADAMEARRLANEEAANVRAEADRYASQVRQEVDEEVGALRAEAAENAARIRQDAEEAAAQVRREAEELARALRAEADEVLAERSEEAHVEAQRIREAAEHERQQIRASADGEINAARSDAIRLVEEAQAVRERVLHDLARRRKQARAHLEQLHAARERLIAAYDQVRTIAEDATRELSVVLPEARAAADHALRRAMAEPEPTIEQLEAEVAAARDIDLPLVEPPEASEAGTAVIEEEAPPEPAAAADAAGPPPAPDDASADAAPDVTSASPQATVAEDAAETASPGDEAATASERRRGGFRRRRKERNGTTPAGAGSGTVSSVPPDVAPEPEIVRDPATAAGPPVPAESAGASGAPESGGDVDELFARLRAEQDATTAAEAETSVAEGAEAVEAEPAATPTPPAEAEGTATSSAKSKAPSKTSKAKATKAATTGELVVPGAEGDQIEEATAPAEGPSEAEAAESAAEAEETEPGAAGDPRFAQRDERLAPIGDRLARRLKRALSDEQGEVLDRLRRTRGRPDTATVLGDADDQRARYVDVARPFLQQAAAEGSAFLPEIGVEGEPGDSSAHSDVELLASELASELVQLLRPRLERALDDANVSEDVVDELELAERIRACYRDWRSQRLSELVDDAMVGGFTLGLYDSVPAGVALQWTTDPLHSPCPDCDDNGLAGGVTKGEEYPTGHRFPPAHPGCRCLLVAHQ